MKTPLDNDLNKVYRAFTQDQDHLRQKLMASLPDPTRQHKRMARAAYVLQFVRSTVLRNGITKIATAAVIIVAVGMGVALLNRSVSPAYAIEQTIKALQDVTTVHVIGTNWDGNRYEAWNKIDPAAGKTIWCCIDQTPHRYKNASRPDGS